MTPSRNSRYTPPKSRAQRSADQGPLTEGDRGGAPRGAVNGYTCNLCNQQIYVRHADPGVTPMLLACRAAGEVGKCGGHMTSMGYPQGGNAPQIQKLVRWEWYFPDAAYLKHLRKKKPEVWQHCKSGGLLLRKLARPKLVDVLLEMANR